MQEVTLRRKSPYSAEQMFALVADVARYQEFLPHCTASQILHEDEKKMSAKLAFAYQAWRGSFVSYVELDRAALVIRAHQERGVFAHLTLRWRFRALAQGGCEIDFVLRFGLLPGFLARWLKPLQQRGIDKAVALFEARADELYAPADKTTRAS